MHRTLTIILCLLASFHADSHSMAQDAITNAQNNFTATAPYSPFSNQIALYDVVFVGGDYLATIGSRFVKELFPIAFFPRRLHNEDRNRVPVVLHT